MRAVVHQPIDPMKADLDRLIPLPHRERGDLFAELSCLPETWGEGPPERVLRALGKF